MAEGKGASGSFWSRFSFGVEELILLLIIVLNVMDAFEILPPDLDYVKKIISWAALGYVLYQAKPSRIIVGSDRPALDVLLIIGYFALIIKNLVSYAMSVIDSASAFLQPFYSSLIAHGSVIERGGIYIGLFLLIVVALRYSLTVTFRRPSIMHLFHEDRLQASSLRNVLIRLVSSFLVIMAFFVIVFNLFMEWLAIAIDAPVLMMGLAAYFFFIFKNREHFSAESFLSRFGDFGESFYKGLIDHLKTFRGALRVLSAMIVLHVLTDAFTFIWPYLIGRADALYFNMISAYHPFLKELFVAETTGAGLGLSLLTGVAYLGNLVAILFLLLAPVFVWYLLYSDRHVTLKGWGVGGIAGSLSLFVLAPGFSIVRLSENGLFGVDIIGQQVSANALLSLPLAVALGVLIGVCCGLLCVYRNARTVLSTALLLASMGFLLYYIGLYSWAVGSYYLFTIPSLFSSGFTVLGVLFTLFFVLTVLFYVFGVIGFLIDIRHHLKRHVSFRA